MPHAHNEGWYASDASPETRQKEALSSTGTDDAFRVVLYNDEEHSFDEVIFQIIKATAYSRSRAEKITWEVHSKGRAIVFSGPIDRCVRISAILEEIDLKTEIQTA